MNRRKALKFAGLTALMTAVNAEAKMAMENMNRMIMKAKDPKKMVEGELKHTPLISIKEKDAKGYTRVEINIGQGDIIHPSTPDHWIDFISLHADDKLIGKNILEPEVSRGATSFYVKLDGIKILKATSGCNLHGIWSSTVNT